LGHTLSTISLNTGVDRRSTVLHTLIVNCTITIHIGSTATRTRAHPQVRTVVCKLTLLNGSGRCSTYISCKNGPSRIHIELSFTFPSPWGKRRLCA